MMNQLGIEVSRKKKGKARYIDFSVLVLAAGSGSFSTYGSLGYAEGLMGMAIALTIGICTFFIFGALWQAAFDSMASRSCQKARWLVLLTALCAGPFIIGLSTTLNATAIAHHIAEPLYLQSFITKAETVLADTQRKSEQLQGLTHDLTVAIETFKKASEDEEALGSYSGTPGTGGVHTALVTITTQLKTVQLSLIDKREGNTDREAEAELVLTDMRQVMQNNASIDQKADLMVGQATHLNKLVTEMNSTGLAQSLGRTMRLIPNETKAIANFSSNRRIESDQKEALERLNNHIETIMAELITGVDAFLATPSAHLPTFERVSANRATILMWRDLISAWVAAAALDLLPYFLLLYIMISSSTITEAERRYEELRSITAGELFDAQTILEASKRLPLSPDLLRPLLDLKSLEEQLKRDSENDKGDE